MHGHSPVTYVKEVEFGGMPVATRTGFIVLKLDEASVTDIDLRNRMRRRGCRYQLISCEIAGNSVMIEKFVSSKITYGIDFVNR